MAAIKPIKVALIGAGAISYTYLNSMVNTFDILDVVGCSDLIPERAKARAELFGIRAMTNEEILSDPEIEIVVNTTYPSSHYSLNKEILLAGKHLYCEKTMAATYEEALELVNLAKEKGLRISAAPDTFLGGGLQTVRKLIEDGMIGEPISVDAVLVRSYNAGGAAPFGRPGGMFAPGGSGPYDMGGYYTHALIHLLGPLTRVSGFARKHPKTFTHPKNANYGEPVDVTGYTTVVGALEFENGCFGTLTVTADGAATDTYIKVYGTQGTILYPDPNEFSCPIYLHRKGNPEPLVMPFTHGYNNLDPATPTLSGKREPGHNAHRGIGVADMAWAIRNGRPHRATGEMGLHTLEIIEGIAESCETGRVHVMQSKPAQPAPLPAGFFGGDAEGCLDT